MTENKKLVTTYDNVPLDKVLDILRDKMNSKVVSVEVTIFDTTKYFAHDEVVYELNTYKVVITEDANNGD